MKPKKVTHNPFTDLLREHLGAKWRKEVSKHMGWSEAKIRYVSKNPSRYITLDDLELMSAFTKISKRSLMNAMYNQSNLFA